jgi:hypothetical protein
VLIGISKVKKVSVRAGISGADPACMYASVACCMSVLAELYG